ncbi:hypothetical protein BX600DRAFT_229780 [Xylariales sp. PMI_506]|nr:hypothetical protein BX600DRAFT_229780 [Xylariales sp. PMI_506]
MSTPAPSQTIFVKDLGTKSVTLYPSGAHIVRDIHDVILKPGINEIEIFGLSPTIDENSVRVDGKGAATVVDMTIELVPNREVFEEVYPETDDGNESLDDDNILDDSDDDTDVVKELITEVNNLKGELEELSETLASAQCRLRSIDQYVQSLSVAKCSPDDIHKILANHEQERAAVFKVSRTVNSKTTILTKKLKHKEHELLRAGKEARKAKVALKKLKEKEKMQRELKKAEKAKAAQYEKQERLRYWPKKVYKVVLQLETNSIHTPVSSRRGSIGSATLAHDTLDDQKQKDEPLESGGTPDDTIISLSLFYVTREAAWTPRYDIEVFSTQKSAIIAYRTEFINHTSETWKDAKISFSTSQTSYQGLNDSVPQISPWKVRLTKEEDGVDGGLLSQQEKLTTRSGNHKTAYFNRQMYFGKEDIYLAPASKAFGQQALSNQQQAMTQQQTTGHQSQVSEQYQHQQQTHNSNHALQDYQMQLMLLEQQNKKRLAMARQEQQPTPNIPAPIGADVLESFDFDSFLAPLEFSEPSWEDNGLTTTYEIPHTRTLVPGSQTRRHKIAALNATNINLSYIAVPKLRSAAFLLAKIRNPSANITLLKGSAGVTLDGSYLGSMPLPQVSPSQIFQLSFGVDPGIQISYPKPSTKRSTQGLFTKERTQVYSRSIWLTNSKKSAVELVVLEQIPVSEEERLKIDITSPRGLQAEGDVVENVGTSAKAAVAGTTSVRPENKSLDSKKWGSALARLKKNGEVAFTVKLEPSGGCLLKLEYEAKMPTSEQITVA